MRKKWLITHCFLKRQPNLERTEKAKVFCTAKINAAETCEMEFHQPQESHSEKEKKEGERIKRKRNPRDWRLASTTTGARPRGASCSPTSPCLAPPRATAARPAAPPILRTPRAAPRGSPRRSGAGCRSPACARGRRAPRRPRAPS